MFIIWRCVLNIPAFLQLCCFTTHFQEANRWLTLNAHDNQTRNADRHTWQHKPSELRHLSYEPDDHDANILVCQDVSTYSRREVTGTTPHVLPPLIHPTYETLYSRKHLKQKEKTLPHTTLRGHFYRYSTRNAGHCSIKLGTWWIVTFSARVCYLRGRGRKWYYILSPDGRLLLRTLLPPTGQFV